MKTYGHLRDQHSTTMAQKVSFSETAPNVFALGSTAIASQDAQSASVTGAEKKAVARAKAKYSYPWWASENPLEVFWGQLSEEVQIVPFEKYHTCAKQAMNREVFPDEFDDRKSLKEEFVERIPKAILSELTSKI